MRGEEGDSKGQLGLRSPHHIQGHSLPHGALPLGISPKLEGKFGIPNS